MIEEADKYLADVTKRLSVFSAEDVGAESFKAVGLLWDELPAVSHAVYDGEKTKASKASKSGYVKLTFNFMVSQKLFVENEERYYPTDRFKALCENYLKNTGDVCISCLEVKRMPCINRIRVNNVKYNFGTQQYDDFRCVCMARTRFMTLQTVEERVC